MSLGSFLLCDIRLFYYNDTRVAIEVILTIHKLFKNYFHILFVVYNGAENQLHVIAFVLCLTVLTISTIKNFYMCNICGVKQTQKAIERCCCCCMQLCNNPFSGVYKEEAEKKKNEITVIHS